MESLIEPLMVPVIVVPVLPVVVAVVSVSVPAVLLALSVPVAVSSPLQAPTMTRLIAPIPWKNSVHFLIPVSS
jgi:hypothetical protein